MTPPTGPPPGAWPPPPSTPTTTSTPPPPTAATWPGCSPPARPGRRPPPPPRSWRPQRERTAARDASGGQRGAAHRGRAGPAAAVGLPAPRPGADRHPRRLRAWGLRGLHGPGRRPADALVPAVRGRDGRGRDHHRRGLPVGRGRPRPGAAGLPGLPRSPVRLLHPRVRHHHHRLAARAPRPHRGAGPPGHRGQPLPLHRLPEHRRLGPAGRRDPAGAAVTTRTIGEPIARREDPRLVAGDGRYLDDLGSGALAAAFVRSPHAAARVLDI